MKVTITLVVELVVRADPGVGEEGQFMISGGQTMRFLWWRDTKATGHVNLETY